MTSSTSADDLSAHRTRSNVRPTVQPATAPVALTVELSDDPGERVLAVA